VTHADACLSETIKTEKQVGESNMTERLADWGGELNPEKRDIDWISEVSPVLERICHKLGWSPEMIGLVIEILTKSPNGLYQLDTTAIRDMRPTWTISKALNIQYELQETGFSDGTYYALNFDIDGFKGMFEVLFESSETQNKDDGVKLLERLPKYDRDAVLSVYGCWLSEVCLDRGGGWRYEPPELETEIIATVLEALELDRTHVLCEAIEVYGQAMSVEQTCVKPVMDLIEFLHYTTAYGSELWRLIVTGALDFQRVAVD
jgi:hypothetical protein